MKKTLTIIAVALLSLPQGLRAEATYGQASDIFNIGAGARSMGMGSAFTALSDDASASYFNPAGLAFLDEHQLMIMHAPLFLDSNYNYIATAHPFGDKWGTVALSDAMLLSDGFQIRDKFNNLRDSNGELSNSAIFGSYARKINQKIGVGGNAKLIQKKVAGFSDNALGIDVGVIYKMMPVLSIGASMSNINSPEIKLDQAADPYRSITRLGVASEVFQGRLTLTADVIKMSQQDNLFAAGLEFTPSKFLALRTGYNANRSYTMGVGIRLKPFYIDYAFSDTDVGAFNKVSLTWAWHNIYKTGIEPPMKEGRAVFPLDGFENQVTFIPIVPQHVVARWELTVKDQAGTAVRTLNGDLRPPEKLVWDAKNSLGEPVKDGQYDYTFSVEYKNGKKWQNQGHIDLALPNHKIEEVIDMSLQLNGDQEETEEVAGTDTLPTAPTIEAAPVTEPAPEAPAEQQ